MKKFIRSITGKVDDDPVLSVDIGASSIKIVELDPAEDSPVLSNAAVVSTPPACFSNNVIDDPSRIGEAIKAAVEANEMKASKVVTAVAGPTSFVKQITTSVMDPKDLHENIGFEAGNYIPHNTNNVYMDYQVLGKKGNALDVLIIAVKNEVVDGYVKSIQAAGLEPVIVDIDCYALENMFESSHPEDSDKTVALLNVGSRFTSVNIQQGGKAIFKGEVSVGGKQYTSAIAEALNMSPGDAEEAKKGAIPEGVDVGLVKEAIERTTENVAVELERQVGFFWSAAETDKPIDIIYMTGGGSLIPGLAEELNAKTGVQCKTLNPLKGMGGLDKFDEDYLKEIGPSLAVSIGLSGRRLGDKENNFE